MFKKERHAFIIHQLNLHNKVLSADLCTMIGVSEDTIRRDLQELSSKGQLIKVHGGALSTGFSDLNVGQHLIYSKSKKTTIAKKAIRLIEKGMFVMTTGGTTILEMVQNLPVNMKATFITGSIPVVNSCLHHPSIETIVIGDRLSKTAKLTYGPDAIDKIMQVNADLCFLGTNAIDIEHGVTDNDWDVVQIKKAMVSAASKVVCMAISEKIQSFQPIQVCEIKKVDYLITELDPEHETLQPFRDAGVTVL